MNAKKLISLILALVLVLAISATAMAAGNGSITIANAAIGEKYTVVKLFDATLSADGESIVYTGKVPEELAAYFTADDNGCITATAAAGSNGALSTDAINAMTTWAEGQTGTKDTATSNTLTFEGLDFGYYVVLSTQGTAISVTSANPDPKIYDKNTKDITAEKKVDKVSYSIGDTVTYTATFDTVNFYGKGAGAKQVIEYTITDTLPEFLKDVVIDSIVITKADGTTEAAKFTDKSFNANGEVVIDWADGVEGSSNPKKWTSKYDNGAKIIVTYHGTLTSVTNINTADTNTVKIQPTVVKDDGTPDDNKPWEEHWKDSAEIKTYAAALKKTDGTNALDGAEFTIAGLTVTNGDAEGEYIVASYDPEDTTASDTLVTNDQGMLYIVGLASDVKLTVTETKAPAGYNKATDPITLTPQVMTTAIYTESGTIYYDADGNVVAKESSSASNETVEKNLDELDGDAVEVVNNAGTELPETGGMGTTMIYIAGGLLVAAAVILLITKRRAGAAE